ncbi:hypothetical protein PCIT_a4150 [Pseudoalteromonas citrea]|uniref:Uncharacterized protein n=1 Tax=Pseudoalteromonas citrea TaxID=43655 RepID=A0AAD4AJ67_9GAMM|nr:hypothetical protein PCIT_a4150 [Pseudoalteromonas citrea]
MYSLHVEGMAENKVDIVVFTKISDPIPTMHAFNANNNIADVGLK